MSIKKMLQRKPEPELVLFQVRVDKSLLDQANAIRKTVDYTWRELQEVLLKNLIIEVEDIEHATDRMMKELGVKKRKSKK